jgi:hypothetical protein
MKSTWETYNGKRLFLVRYDHLSMDGLRAEVGVVEKEAMLQSRNSILMLIETAGTIISPEALNLFKDVALRTKSVARKTAVLGVTGARRSMLDLIVKFSGLSLVAFDDAQQAKDWLVTE